MDGYLHWKETETTANVIPDTPQKIRARFKPVNPGSGRPPFTRIESDNTSDEYRIEYQRRHGRNIDRDDGEYRADVDYAVRDGIRFDNASGPPPGPPGQPDVGYKSVRNGKPPKEYFADGGGRGFGSGDSAPRRSSGVGEPQRRGFDGPQDRSQNFDGNVDDRARRFEQGSRDNSSNYGDSRIDRRGTQFEDRTSRGPDYQGRGGYDESYNQPSNNNNNNNAGSQYGGNNSRRDNDSSRYRGDQMDNRPNERVGDEPRRAVKKDPYRSSSRGQDRSWAPSPQGCFEGRNSGPPRGENDGGWRDDQRGMQSTRDESYRSEQPRRDDDRKRPFKEEPSRSVSDRDDYRRQESDPAERRSSTGSRGYTLDPPPSQRRRHS